MRYLFTLAALFAFQSVGYSQCAGPAQGRAFTPVRTFVRAEPVRRVMRVIPHPIIHRIADRRELMTVFVR